MGLFDFFKKKARRHIAYPFTTTNSFRLFTEGLRAFQIWQGYATRIRYSEDLGRTQESYLTEALSKFQECYDRYPDDMLPAFYLAVTYSGDGRRDESLALFRKLALKDPNGDIGKSAQFNIVALEHGDTKAEAAKLGLPQPPEERP